MIYEALGYPDNMGITMSDHAHCAKPNGLNEQTIFSNFVKKFLFDDAAANTSPSYVVKNDANLTIDKTKWISWTAPVLEGELPEAPLDHE
jgi:hypothetical protein